MNNMSVDNNLGELKEKRRGFDENDNRWFSDEAIEKLRTAQKEIVWLLDRGYKISSIIELVGGHYQLSARQRMALQRASCTSKQKENRQQKLKSYQAVEKGCVYVDGFNLIITLEVALSGSVLIMGSDGCIRDMAGLRGTYKLIDKTETALQLIGKTFSELEIYNAKFYLDSPVSNSGRLKSKILEYAATWGIPVDVELISNPDSILSGLDNVITSDSVILDNCKSWINLSRRIIEDNILEARIIYLSPNHNNTQ